MQNTFLSMDLGTSFEGPTNKTLMVLLTSAAVLWRAFAVDTTFCSCAQVLPWNTCGFLGSSGKYSLVTYAVALYISTAISSTQVRSWNSSGRWPQYKWFFKENLGTMCNLTNEWHWLQTS